MGRQPKTSHDAKQPLAVEDREAFARLCVERMRRDETALKLFRPLPQAMPFLLSRAPERILRGGNRSSKTTTAAALVASAATGITLTAPDGAAIPHQFPIDRPLLIWVFGYGESHIGGTVYPKLFRPGAFRIIKDEVTGKWRSWRPWDAKDLSREKETKLAPPLIPERFIEPKGWAWSNAGERVFSVCRLKNGTEIRAFTSGGECPQGQAVDLVWIDEDVKVPAHINELRMRGADYRGKLIWSAWPHRDNDALYDMHQRAESQRDIESPDIIETVLRFSDNPYIAADEKRRILAGFSDAERQSRDDGLFQIDSVRAFPSFDAALHGLPSDRQDTALDRFLTDRGYEIPREWPHFVGLDPGHTHPAVVIAVVPPPAEFGDVLLITDEVYAPGVDAMKLAELTAARLRGRRCEFFVIDMHAGRQTTIGYGKRIVDIYAAAFRKYNLYAATTGSGFLMGSDDVQSRNMQVRELLAQREDGTTRLRIIKATTPATQRQFILYRKRLAKDAATEEYVRRDNDCMDALAYIVAAGPRYTERVVERDMEQPGYRAWKEVEKQFSPAGGDEYAIWLGAGRSPASAV